MNHSFNHKSGLTILLFILLMVACKSSNDEDVVVIPEMNEEQEEEQQENELVEGIDYFLPNIDLNNWKVTLPIGNPTEVKPPEILDYANNSLLKDFMYNDSTDASLVFYTYPGATTTNTSYSRTELREQITPGSNNDNWTFAEGGHMRGTLAMSEISKDSDGDYHRTIVMQIHGRLTNEQRDLIEKDDNDAPPILKIYWNKGYVRVLHKVLKDTTVSDTEALHKDAWEDEGVTMDAYVGFEPFTLEVNASEGRLEIILNDEESLVYEDIHMQRWGMFENYFKAGNYLTTNDQDAFARIKYYDLVVDH